MFFILYKIEVFLSRLSFSVEEILISLNSQGQKQSQSALSSKEKPHGSRDFQVISSTLSEAVN